MIQEEKARTNHRASMSAAERLVSRYGVSGVRAGNFVGVRKIFRADFTQVYPKTSRQQTFSLYIFCC